MLLFMADTYHVNRIQALIVLVASGVLAIVAALVHRMPLRPHLRPVRSYALVSVSLGLVLLAVALSGGWVHHNNPDSSPGMWCAIVLHLYFLIGTPVTVVLFLVLKLKQRNLRSSQ
jgi:hypothetical protein